MLLESWDVYDRIEALVEDHYQSWVFVPRGSQGGSLTEILSIVIQVESRQGGIHPRHQWPRGFVESCGHVG